MYVAAEGYSLSVAYLYFIVTCRMKYVETVLIPMESYVNHESTHEFLSTARTNFTFWRTTVAPMLEVHG